jgi:hypothetical protein
MICDGKSVQTIKKRSKRRFVTARRPKSGPALKYSHFEIGLKQDRALSDVPAQSSRWEASTHHKSSRRNALTTKNYVRSIEKVSGETQKAVLFSHSRVGISHSGIFGGGGGRRRRGEERACAAGRVGAPQAREPHLIARSALGLRRGGGGAWWRQARG